MNYSLKKASIKDLDAIYQLQTDYNNLILSKNSLKKDLENELSYYLIAENKNQVIGAIGINILVDHADITMVITNKDFSNLGIGTALLNNVITKCKELKLKKLFLEVRSSNIVAIHLYQKVGFTNISIRKNYYSDTNEDALIYVKEI